MSAPVRALLPDEDPDTVCRKRGYHDYQELIDPRYGGFVRCRDCGHEVDCEEDEEW